MLTLETIPRVKAGTAVTTTNDFSGRPVDTARLTLATRAKDLLGYEVLRAEVTGQRKFAASEGKLTNALRDLEIDVLDTAAVIEYQLEEISRRNRESIHANLKEYTTGWFNTGQWHHTELSKYQMPVPEFVLDKAVRLKEAVPEVNFYVQHLSDPKADPFLVARLGEEIYFIDAWDEPRFEQTL